MLFIDQAGDRICIFGFSRGAYTARALAGMVHKVSGVDPSDVSIQTLMSLVPGWSIAGMQSSTSSFCLQNVYTK